MIKSLEIKDYAVIEGINVEFGKGLNIITGETGTGKSILIDAMGLILGERASTEVIRKGAAKSVIEGIFEVDGNKKVKSILEENDIDFFPEMIVRREISLKGSNRCFLNDTPVSLSLIKEIGNLLVDLHGQHEHQSLLHTETHIDYLDEFGNYDKLLLDYISKYDELCSIESELESLQEREDLLNEKKEIYSFQIKEIDNISPDPGEEDKLNDELIILENSERLVELTSQVYQILYDSEDSVHDSIVKAQSDLGKLSAIDKSFEESSGEIETILALINDISAFIQSYKAKLDIDPKRIEEVRDRLGAINLLKKKYGGSVDSVLAHRKKIGDEFELAENFEGKIRELNRRLNECRITTGKLALEISGKRKIESNKIKRDIESSLKELGILHPNFETKIANIESDNNSHILVDGNPYKYSSKGFDRVEFFISTNAGEDPKPLAKVASGGEVSRIMLSLKSTLAKNDKLPLLIFDEIDVGVSGRIAQRVGQVLKNLSSFHQVIAITHLPQIAGQADQHYVVNKTDKDNRVSSSIRLLNKEERVSEVAKLMSGEKLSDASIKGAKELMGLSGS
ncbi:MAG: DNA repair protein RecN [Ignavibacteria bacterium]|jgi:DNA repair protein RecN (Recombination protein N)